MVAEARCLYLRPMLRTTLYGAEFRGLEPERRHLPSTRPVLPPLAVSSEKSVAQTVGRGCQRHRPSLVGRNRGWTCTSDGESYLLETHRSGAYRVDAEGIRYSVKGVAAAYVWYWISGLCFAIWARLHDCLVLHGCVLDHGGEGWVILGRSRAGKSTLLAKMCLSGEYRFVSDDLCVIFFEKGVGYGTQGPRLFRMWPDTVREVGLEGWVGSQVSPGTKKRYVFADQVCMPSASNAVPIAEVRSLKSDGSRQLESASKVDLFSSVYGADTIGPGAWRGEIDRIGRLAQRIGVRRLDE